MHLGEALEASDLCDECIDHDSLRALSVPQVRKFEVKIFWHLKAWAISLNLT